MSCTVLRRRTGRTCLSQTCREARSSGRRPARQELARRAQPGTNHENACQTPAQRQNPLGSGALQSLTFLVVLETGTASLLSTTARQSLAAEAVRSCMFSSQLSCPDSSAVFHFGTGEKSKRLDAATSPFATCILTKQVIPRRTGVVHHGLFCYRPEAWEAWEVRGFGLGFGMLGSGADVSRKTCRPAEEILQHISNLVV